MRLIDGPVRRGQRACGPARAAAIALVMAVGSACGSSSSTSSSASHPKVDSLTLASTLELTSLDGILSNHVESSHTVYDPLVRIRPDGSLEPSLATKWTANADATQWTFSIRGGVKFSDGSALTPDDVVWTYNTILASDKSLNKPNISPYLKGASKAGDSDVVFDMKVPFAAWPRQSSLIPIVSRKAYESLGATAFASHPVGTGPYTVSSFTPSQTVVYQANKSYWGGAPAIKQVTLQFIANETTRVNALQSNSIDLAVISPATADTARSAKSLTVKSVPSNLVTYVGFNVNAAPLTNLKLRQAIDMAIDRQAIAKTLFKGDAAPIGQLLAPASFGYDPSFKPTAFDTAKAKQLVQDSGYAGQPITFAYPNGPAVPQAAEVAQAIDGYLSAVGIKLQLKAEDQTTFVSDWMGRKFTGMFMFSYQPSTLDAGVVVTHLFLSDSTGYAKDTTLEGLVLKQAGQANPKDRLATLVEMQKRSNDNEYYAPLVVLGRVYAWNPSRVSPTTRADGYLFPQDMKQP
jgi:peptide/nickel transport system substrate-binding protein